MKKKIFAAAVAFVATMSLATSAFATEAGGTNGTASTTVKVEADKPTEFTTDKDLAITAPAGAFEAGVEVKMDADVTAPKAEAVAAETKTIEAAVADIAKVTGDAAKATVNTKIAITLTADGKSVQPKEEVEVVVAPDDVSNAVAFVDGKKVEFIKLDKEGGKWSFKAKHFSDYYLVTVDDTLLSKLEGKSTEVKDDTNNPNTGIALAIAPAALAVAFVGVTAVVSKKKRG